MSLPDNNLNSDILLLYELSLSIGHCQDLERNCKAFLDTLMARKGLSYCSVWLNTDNGLVQTDAQFSIIYSTPVARTMIRELPLDHPGLDFEGQCLTCDFGDPCFQQLICEDSIVDGSYAVFRLDDFGFLKLYRSGDTGFSQRELHQLQVVVDIFAVSLAGALSHTQLIQESHRKEQAQTSLQRQQALMHSLIDSMPDLIFYKDLCGSYLGCNKAFESYVALNEKDLIGKCDLDMFEPDIAIDYRKKDKAVLDSGEACRNEKWITYPDGRRVLLDILKTPYYGPNGEILGLIGVSRDITEQKATERALQRAQKMDALGQLTGGIAHDFNNILGIIIGNIELISKPGSTQEENDRRIRSIEKSARRASELTKQLLSFSRQKPASSHVCSVNELLTDINSLIARSLTPEIEIINDLDPDIWYADIDPGDFQDAVLNIALNAHDAMSGRGVLQIHSENIPASDISRRQSQIPAGDYVHLAISDTGCGMKQEILERIFEPFFTTKSSGKGTGLGLSMVYSFMTRSNGHIDISSHPGNGTQINLYFPKAIAQTVSTEATEQPASEIPQGTETIMIVDDEEMLLMVAEDMFRELGYNTLTASDCLEALDILSGEQQIDLLFSDVVMPGRINGFELASQAKLLKPELKVLMTSGYTDIDIAGMSGEDHEMSILVKPYQLNELASKVRATLDNEIDSVTDRAIV